MTTTIVHCDRCAAKIDQGRARLVLAKGGADDHDHRALRSVRGED
jgi:hypothetical protein